MPKTAHILDGNRMPFCGIRNPTEEASETTAEGLCARCLAAYRKHAHKTVDEAIDKLAWDLAAYLTLLPEDARLREHQVLVKSLEVRMRAYQEKIR